MGAIYSQAAQVLVWLGSSFAGEEEALAFILSTAMSLRYAPLDLESLYPDPQHLPIPPWTFPIWSTVGAILSRPWFSHLWKMQEVFSNANVNVFCGRARLQWEELVSLISHLGVQILPKHRTRPHLESFTPSTALQQGKSMCHQERSILRC